MLGRRGARTHLEAPLHQTVQCARTSCRRGRIRRREGSGCSATTPARRRLTRCFASACRATPHVWVAGAMQQPPAPAAALPLRHIKLSASRSAFHYVEVCVSAFQNGETELEISGLGAGSSHLPAAPSFAPLVFASARLIKLTSCSDDVRGRRCRHAANTTSSRAHTCVPQMAQSVCLIPCEQASARAPPLWATSRRSRLSWSFNSSAARTSRRPWRCGKRARPSASPIDDHPLTILVSHSPKLPALCAADAAL